MPEENYTLTITFTDGEQIESAPFDGESVRAIYSVIGLTETRIMVPLAGGKSTYMAPGTRIHSVVATLVETSSETTTEK